MARKKPGWCKTPGQPTEDCLLCVHACLSQLLSFFRQAWPHPSLSSFYCCQAFSVCFHATGFLLLKGGNGIFNVRNAIITCCLHTGETGSDEFAQALTRGKGYRFAVYKDFIIINYDY